MVRLQRRQVPLMKEVVIRIASGVGAVKREAIQKLAEQMKLRVLNPKKFVPRVPKPKGKKGEKKQEETKKEEPKIAEARKEEPKQAAAPTAKPAEAKKEEKPSAAPQKQ